LALPEHIHLLLGTDAIQRFQSADVSPPAERRQGVQQADAKCRR
jgi:hypothetical protein